ncbi:MAG TPA: succinate dehydrogenase, hydrophobic membrane anchor protein [Xanthomonadaceae bacterium]|jgi:succinate dehydrogenase / fumarate reductase membrane anchor subunit|nr:succinate dehydrogenase, hydrophobic membrane anchor protein [Xanthomonadaceae bacterium]
MSAPGMDKSMRNPLAQARGLGSAKDGVHHWWMQRLTAIALALLSPWFIWLLLSLLGASHAEVRSTLANPRCALPLLAFVLALFWHAKLGLQVVIEDYVHTRWMEVALQVVMTFACALGALASVFAIMRIVLAH